MQSAYGEGSPTLCRVGPANCTPEPLTEPNLNLSAYPARATHGRLPSSTDFEFLRLPVDSDQYG
jgi:hypothetical protein